MSISNHFFENNPLGIMYHNHLGEITNINSIATKYLDLPKEKLARKTLFNPDWHIINKDGSDYLSDNLPLIHSIKNNKAIQNLILGILKPEKENYIWLKFNIMSEFTKEEKDIPYIITTIEDISDSINLKKKLKQNEKKSSELLIEEENITSIVIDQKKISQYQKNSRDNAHSKRIAQELEDNKNMLQATLDNMPGGFIMIDNNYSIKQVNKQACLITGYTQKELLGSLCDIICPKGSASKNCPIWANGKTSFLGMDTFIKCKDGSKTPIIKNAQTININGNKFLIESFQNISILKQTESELIKAKEKAEESDRLKSAFLANMSHEIRTPMNGILGFTNLLKSPNFSNEQRKTFIKSICKSGNRMLNTVNDIVKISEIEVGQIRVKKTNLNINKTITEIVDFFRSEANKKNIKLELDLFLNDEKSIVNMDKSKFESIITNIIKNAIKYSDYGTIKFGYKRNKSKLEFYCKDQGIGIPKKKQKAIFNRFEQADISDTRAFQGSGLGLAITKAYVNILDGEIWVDSIEGKGSVFYFTLPFTPIISIQKPKQLANTLEEKILDKPKHMIKLLIVEDDKISAQHLKIILNNQYHTIFHANSGKEAIQIMIDNPDIKIILMDIQLPKINGYDTTRKIRKFNKNVYIIAQTADTLEFDREKSLKAGCNDYISKPINKELLLKKLNSQKIN